MKTVFTLFFALIGFSVFSQGKSAFKPVPESLNTTSAVFSQAQTNKSITVIYSQDFEGEFPPQGWIKLNPDNGTGWESIAVGTSPVPGWEGGTITASPAGGTKVAFCTYETGGTTKNDQWLISPQITVGPGYRFSFYMRYIFDHFDDNVEIRISKTNNTQPTSFDILVDRLQFRLGSSKEWIKYSYALNDFVDDGDNIFIAFREYVDNNLDDGSAITLDLFEVYTEDSPAGFEVTFNLNMAGVEGFDEQLHKVFLSGNFSDPEWAEPGQPGSVELQFNPEASFEHEIFYFEGFENWDPGFPDVLPAGWQQKRTNALTEFPVTNAAFPAWVLNNPDSNPFGGDPPNPNAWKGYIKTGQGSLVIGYTAPDFTWAITPEINIPDAEEVLLSYWKWYRHLADENWFTNYHVMIYSDGEWNLLRSFIGNQGAPANLLQSAVEIDLAAFGSKTVRLAFVYEYTDGYQMAIDDIKVSGIRKEDVGKKLIFTARLQGIPAGRLEYKYFSDAFGPGFDGAEWPGEPDRLVWVDKKMVLNDVWNQYVHDPNVSVDEIMPEYFTRVFPNPVRDRLFIQSDHQIDYLRLFDLTGRLVYQDKIRGSSTSINTSLLNSGIYFLQLFSGKNNQTIKVQVVK